MSTPDFGDGVNLIGDYLMYPRRVLLEALQSGFASPFFFTAKDQIPNPYLYKKNEAGTDTAEDSAIEIADGWSDELDKTAPRPIILCQRDTFQFKNMSIGGIGKTNLPWGDKKHFAEQVILPLNFLCFSRIDTESDTLALVVGFFLKLFREHLRNSSKVFEFDSPVIGPPTPVRTDVKVDLFSTPVSVVTHYSIAWQFEWTNLIEASGVAVETTAVGE